MDFKETSICWTKEETRCNNTDHYVLQKTLKNNNYQSKASTVSIRLQGEQDAYLIALIPFDSTYSFMVCKINPLK